MINQVVHVEKNERIGFITTNNPTVNVLNTKAIEQLSKTDVEMEEDSEVGSPNHL